MTLPRHADCVYPSESSMQKNNCMNPSGSLTRGLGAPGGQRSDGRVALPPRLPFQPGVFLIAFPVLSSDRVLFFFLEQVGSASLSP